MPESATIPTDCLDLFQKPFLGDLSYLNGRGQIVTFPVWVDFDGTIVLTSSPVGSRKGKALRERNQVAVCVLDPQDVGHWVSISGRVVDIRPDEDLAFADRMAQKYMGSDYPLRTPREIFGIAIDRVSKPGVWARD